ncbi:hypothetical protein ADUPG1_009950, partial [Aduncisulcus paluster]
MSLFSKYSRNPEQEERITNLVRKKGLFTPELVSNSNGELHYINIATTHADLSHYYWKPGSSPKTMFFRSVCYKTLIYIAELARYGISHGDIHPRNIMINRKDGNICLIDFENGTDNCSSKVKHRSLFFGVPAFTSVYQDVGYRHPLLDAESCVYSIARASHGPDTLPWYRLCAIGGNRNDNARVMHEKMAFRWAIMQIPELDEEMKEMKKSSSDSPIQKQKIEHGEKRIAQIKQKREERRRKRMERSSSPPPLSSDLHSPFFSSAIDREHADEKHHDSDKHYDRPERSGKRTDIDRASAQSARDSSESIMSQEPLTSKDKEAIVDPLVILREQEIRRRRQEKKDKQLLKREEGNEWNVPLLLLLSLPTFIPHFFLLRSTESMLMRSIMTAINIMIGLKEVERELI